MSQKITLRTVGEGWQVVRLDNRLIGRFRVFEGLEPPVLATLYLGVVQDVPEYSQIGYFKDSLKAQRAIVVRHFKLIEEGRFRPFRQART